MKPQVEQQLAHVLLTELLAYQFASPVRWIETQDVILAQKKAERIVEIGPSATLSGMLQRTLRASYQEYDAALSLQRAVLTTSKDAKDIYYEREPEIEEPEAAGASAAAQSAPSAQDAQPAAQPAVQTTAPTGPVAQIDDVPLTALQVLHTIIAAKLRKTLDQVPVTKSIRDLVGGKSTVQNEILGDLAKEFAASPEKAEEIPISELAEEFADSFSGKLGKHTSSLIARSMSSKMPGGFGLSPVRKYLSTRWGLGAGRQDAVLLLAITREPAARLENEAAAKTFLDEITNVYAAGVGLNLAATSAASGSDSGAGAVISAEALAEVTKDHKYLVRQQLELFANHLRLDLREGDKRYVAEKETSEVLQKELDLWLAEHGDAYADGIKPMFSSLKARVYDSSWNWARQDAFTMFYDIIWGNLDTVDREVVARCIALINRTNSKLIDLILFYIDTVPTERGPTFQLAKDLAQQLLDNTTEFQGHDPVYKDVSWPMAPKTTVGNKGDILYAEEPRPACRKLEQYVLDMAAGSDLTKDQATSPYAHLEKVYASLELTDEVAQAYELLKSRITQQNVPFKGMKQDIVPYLNLRTRTGETWNYDRQLTGQFLSVLESVARDGVTYKGKMVLLTGAGKESIGAKILEGLLSGGAKVVVTTSRYSKETCDYYQSIYTRFGSTGSALVIVPFNQASKSDVKSLIKYIYDPAAKGGLGWDLDFIIPFAAIPEGGMQIDGIESRSELAHRLMLTNLLRLLGEVKLHKEANSVETRPSQVILPLSPNHGTFGGDGLYSESKLALETLFNRWHSESWASYLTICGAVIGWTRGTGLMAQNNLVAEGIEKLGVRTFSQTEMAFNLLGLMHPQIVDLCQKSPVWADLNGGMQNVPELKEYMADLRKTIVDTAELRRAVAIETAIEHKVVSGPNADAPFSKDYVQPRANLKFDFPELKPYEELPTQNLRNMVDLSKVAVITGFAEVGPYGNSRTRWEMEAFGTFSIEGSIEMAWIMGLITYHNGNLKGKPYSGWIDAKSKEPVEESDVKAKYEKHILDHSGIRLVEPDLLNYDPRQKQFLQEIIVEHDLEPFESSKDTAEQFKLEQGDKVEVFPIPDSDQWTVRFLKGSRLLVPKALQYNRLVAGQIPTGWDARRYGVPEDICDQVDEVTLFTLVSTVEALLASGVTDPYEFYKYVHVSEIANASGSGMGGMTALRKMFKDRYLDKPVQNDILQESFINTMSAWVNMLLLSASGPIKTPVGACATAVESLDTGVELIRNGTAKVVIVGGYDDIKEEGIYEFGNMNATSNSVDEMAHGRTPREMSRPSTTTRSGFMEAHGSGIQILMSGKLAVEMGVPIHGIVALTAMASDKIGRSVPAPGKGIMTVAREVKREGSHQYPPLDIKYRQRQLGRRRAQIKQWVEDEHSALAREAKEYGFSEAETAERLQVISDAAHRQEREAMSTWGNEFYLNDPNIAPLRGALATWDLTIDDLGVSSFHGTSTKANDKNESAAIHDMLVHLGRSKGNPVFGVFQKYLTGHPKGAAGAWMLNGVLQSINTGIVPGNRNADNIDPELEKFDRILYPSITHQTYGLKAGTVTSFGFGQKGGIALLIHPDYFFSVLDKSTYEGYAEKVRQRHLKVYRFMHDSMCSNSMFKAKDKAPYESTQEQEVYLNPLARVDESLKFPKDIAASTTAAKKLNYDTMTSLASLSNNVAGSVGVDVELVTAIDTTNTTFIERNFTKSEQEYCWTAPDPRASFAGTWSAKEAVFKSLEVPSAGAGASLIDIEILRTPAGPKVALHGRAAQLAGSKQVKVSISHNDLQAVAVASASEE